jgi:hypothetical protein
MLIKAAGTPDTAGTLTTEGMSTRKELQEQKGCQQKQEPSYSGNTNNSMNGKSAVTSDSYNRNADSKNANND